MATTDVPPPPKRSVGDLFIDAIKAANTAIETVDKKLAGPPREKHSPNFPFHF